MKNLEYVSFEELYSMNVEITDICAERQKWIKGVLFSRGAPRKSNAIIFLNGCNGIYSDLKENGTSFFAPQSSIVCLPEGSNYSVLNNDCDLSDQDAYMIEFRIKKNGEPLSFAPHPFIIKTMFPSGLSHAIKDVVHTYEMPIPLYDNEDSVCGILYNSVPYYFIKNLQGDVIAIVDKDAETVAKYSYDSWGVPTIKQDISGCQIATINPFRYRSYYYDEEIDLYYLQSRYYNANVGRFVNGDDSVMACVVEGKIAHNIYTYCKNSTVMHRDDSGYVAANVIGAIIGGVIGAIGGYVLTSWLADRLNLKGWKRNLFIWGLTALIGAAAAAIGYFVGPYVAKAWYALRAKLSGLIRGSFKSIQNITSSKMKHINTSKHLWGDVLGKQSSNVNIKNLIYRAIRNGEWIVLDNGTIGIHWRYAGKLIEITGNVVNGVFKVGNAWVWNGISKLLF